MEIVDLTTKSKVLDKISRHLNISHYYDIHELTEAEFWKKYGYLGIGQQNFLEIRFYPKTNVVAQLKKLLSPRDDYFVLPVDGSREIYSAKMDMIDAFFIDHSKAHLIVVDCKFRWVLIKNEHNKLIGIGDMIKVKMGKLIQMTFGNERIMYSLSDSKDEDTH